MQFILQEASNFELMAVLLFFSAMFSGSETALFSLSKVELRRFALSDRFVSRAATALAKDQSEFLGTVLFCNMLVNILFYSISAGLSLKVAHLHGHGAAFGFGLATLLLVIIFGEVTPKSLAVIAPASFMKVFSTPMYLLHFVCRPIRKVLRYVRMIIERIAASGDGHGEGQLDELKLLLKASAEDGDLSHTESALVGEVIDLSAIKVKEFMTPRVDLAALPELATCDEVLEASRKSGRTYILLYRESIDKIVGVVSARRIFLENLSGDKLAPVETPLIITEYQRASTALKDLHKKKVQVAVVVDEYGGTAGIVTVSDILEEIFGEGTLDDAGPIPPVSEISDGVFMISGDLSLRDWRVFLEFSGHLPSVDTVGGLVACMLGKIPAKGDKVKLGRVEMTVERTRRRRVEVLRLCLLPEENEGEDA